MGWMHGEIMNMQTSEYRDSVSIYRLTGEYESDDAEDAVEEEHDDACEADVSDVLLLRLSARRRVDGPRLDVVVSLCAVPVARGRRQIWRRRRSGRRTVGAAGFSAPRRRRRRRVRYGTVRWRTLCWRYRLLLLGNQVRRLLVRRHVHLLHSEIIVITTAVV